MPTNDYIQPFFNIKGEFITNSYRKDDSLIYEVMLPVTEHTCPCCGHTTKYIKDYRVRTDHIAWACHVSVTTVIRYCFLISISRPKELPTVLGIYYLFQTAIRRNAITRSKY